MFITCDHPSVWTLVNTPADDAKPELHLVTLPLTPKYTAVAYDRRVLQVKGGQASVEDDKTLNLGQIENADRCIYTSKSLSDEHMAIIKNLFERKKTVALRSEVHENTWLAPMLHLPAEHHFSFIRVNPPLM